MNFIHPFNDNSGYITIGSASSKPYIWKYLFASPTSISCQTVTTLSGFAQGQFKISEYQFLLLGNKHIIKFYDYSKFEFFI